MFILRMMITLMKAVIVLLNAVNILLLNAASSDKQNFITRCLGS